MNCMAKKNTPTLHLTLVTVLLFVCLLCIFLNNGFWHALFYALLFFGLRWLLRRWTQYKSSGWVIFRTVFLVMLFGASSFLFTLVRSETNYVFFFDHSAPMKVLMDDEWVSINNATKIDLSDEFISDEVKVQTVYFKRSQPKILGKVKNLILQEQIRVFTFKPENDFYLISDVTNRFHPMSQAEAQSRKQSDFLINASFYDRNNNAIGEIYYLGEKYQNKSSSSGYFKVIDGRPHAGPESIFTPYRATPYYACQAHPSTMKNGTIFGYIDNEQYLGHRKWGKKTYRNLIGEKEDGSIVFVVSNNGGLLSVKEVTQVAQRIGVKHAALFDAGIALQYAFNHPDYHESFSAFNNEMDAGNFCDRVCMRLFRKNFIQRSPVYIGIKVKTE